MSCPEAPFQCPNVSRCHKPWVTLLALEVSRKRDWDCVLLFNGGSIAYILSGQHCHLVSNFLLLEERQKLRYPFFPVPCLDTSSSQYLILIEISKFFSKNDFTLHTLSSFFSSSLLSSLGSHYLSSTDSFTPLGGTLLESLEPCEIPSQQTENLRVFKTLSRPEEDLYLFLRRKEKEPCSPLWINNLKRVI